MLEQIVEVLCHDIGAEGFATPSDEQGVVWLGAGAQTHIVSQFLLQLLGEKHGAWLASFGLFSSESHLCLDAAICVDHITHS